MMRDGGMEGRMSMEDGVEGRVQSDRTDRSVCLCGRGVGGGGGGGQGG